MDLSLGNFLDKVSEEKPFALEEAFLPPKSSFQGERRFVPEYNHYMSAPELLPPVNFLKNPRRIYDMQVDSWAMGCLIYNMATGVPTFWYELHPSEMIPKIRAGLWRENFASCIDNPSVNLVDILERCFIIDPAERINSAQIISHPFF